MQKLSHRGYEGWVDFNPSFGFFAGRLIGVQGVVAFRGDSVEDAIIDFQNAVDTYIDSGIPRQIQASENLWIDFDPEVLERAREAAAEEGVVLSVWIAKAVRQVLDSNA